MFWLIIGAHLIFLGHIWKWKPEETDDSLKNSMGWATRVTCLTFGAGSLIAFILACLLGG